MFKQLNTRAHMNIHSTCHRLSPYFHSFIWKQLEWTKKNSICSHHHHHHQSKDYYHFIQWCFFSCKVWIIIIIFFDNFFSHLIGQQFNNIQVMCHHCDFLMISHDYSSDVVWSSCFAYAFIHAWFSTLTTVCVLNCCVF